MSGIATGHQHDPGRYEIRVQGRLEPRWAAWFDGMALTADKDGTTTIHGPVVDQAALHGLLRKLCDVGLPLLSVRRVPPVQATPAPAAERSSPPVGPHPPQRRRSTVTEPEEEEVLSPPSTPSRRHSHRTAPRDRHGREGSA